MNITEANHAQRLLAWVTELVSFEHSTGDTLGRSTVTDGDLIETVRALADRSRQALGAGMDADTAEQRVRVVLGVVGTDPESYRDDLAAAMFAGDDTSIAMSGPGDVQ